MVKRISGVLLALVLCLSLLPGQAKAATQIASGNCGTIWGLYDDGLLRLGYSYDLTSTNSYKSGQSPFYAYRDKIKRVELQNIYNIGAYLFEGCEWMTSVSWDDTLKTIGNNAFDGCINLSGTLTFGGNAKWVGSCSFRNCKSLTGLVLSDNFNEINHDAFFGCSSLASVSIGSGLSTLGNYAFGGCTSLTSLTVSEYNVNFKSVDNVIFNAAGNELLVCAGGKSGRYTVPSAVDTIHHGAFYGCDKLTGVMLPGSVTSLGTQSFDGCSAMVSMTIPSGVTSIAKGTFQNCSSLANLTIPSGMKEIGEYAFRGCNSLASVTIPSGVTSIGANAFERCTGLVSVTVPAGADIDATAFDGCAGLAEVTISGEGNMPNYVQDDPGCTSPYYAVRDSLQTVKFGSGVTSIGNYAFYSCSGLTAVTVPNNVESIGYRAFASCGKLASVSIGNGTTGVSTSAFEGCKKLTKLTVSSGNNEYLSVDNVLFNKTGKILFLCPEGKTGAYTVPDTVRTIGTEAFSGCTGLTGVSIPSSVLNISSGAFRGCTGLGSISFPVKLTTVESETFSGCTGLTSVTIPDAVTSIGDCAFQGCTGLARAVIPAGATVSSTAFEGCEKLSSLVINGTGAMADYNSSPFHSIPLRSVTFQSGVTSVGSNAFYGCEKLDELTLTSSITRIGTDAFSGCYNLYDVYFLGTRAQWEQISGTDQLQRAEITYVTKYSLTGSFEKNKLVAKITIPSGSATLAAACYDDSGRLVSVRTISVKTCINSDISTGLAVTPGYTYKLMLLDRKTNVPLCKAWSKKA